MSILNKIQAGLEKIIGPLATWLSSNKYVKAVSEGFMSTMPITIGAAFIAILINIPFAGWTKFLNTSGIYSVANDFLSATMSLLGIYVVICISYRFTKNANENVIAGVALSTAAYIGLLPIQHITVAENTTESMFKVSQMGSNGIFVAILCGLIVPALFCWLMQKNLKLKLPSSVPPMVSDTLNPTFVAMIIFTLVFAVKYLFTLTAFGDVFTFINDIVAKPVMGVGTSPWAVVFVYTFMNLMWFFGIHPSPIMGAYSTVLYAAAAANIQAYVAGAPLPHQTWAIAYLACYVGGTGCTLGLCVATLFAKSSKYKEMRKLVIPANIFNINEPIIFGFPTMLNPVYFIPMVFGSAVSGTVAILLTKVLPFSLNPTIQLPWITPGFVQAFMSGGVMLLMLWLLCVALHFLLYLPFFLIDDNNALKEEQNSAVNAD